MSINDSYYSYSYLVLYKNNPLLITNDINKSKQLKQYDSSLLNIVRLDSIHTNYSITFQVIIYSDDNMPTRLNKKQRTLIKRYNDSYNFNYDTVLQPLIKLDKLHIDTTSIIKQFLGNTGYILTLYGISRKKIIARSTFSNLNNAKQAFIHVSNRFFQSSKEKIITTSEHGDIIKLTGTAYFHIMEDADNDVQWNEKFTLSISRCTILVD
jgi:hypothetical protein